MSRLEDFSTPRPNTITRNFLTTLSGIRQQPSPGIVQEPFPGIV